MSVFYTNLSSPVYYTYRNVIKKYNICCWLKLIKKYIQLTFLQKFKQSFETHSSSACCTISMVTAGGLTAVELGNCNIVCNLKRNGVLFFYWIWVVSCPI